MEKRDERWGKKAQAALVGFASEFVEQMDAGADRGALEQALCFAGAVWNAMVLMDGLDDPFALADIVKRIDDLEEPFRAELSDALWSLCERKSRLFPDGAWVYRHLHVVRGKTGELRVRCEVLSLSAWVASGEPLRMGLLD